MAARRSPLDRSAIASKTFSSTLTLWSVAMCLSAALTVETWSLASFICLVSDLIAELRRLSS